MVDQANEPELQLRLWLRVLRRRWPVMAATLVVALVAASVLLATRSPVYRAEAQVSVGSSSPVSTNQYRLDATALAELARSVDVSREASKALGRPVDPSVEVRGDDVLSIQVPDSGAKSAAEAANAVADALVEVRAETVQGQLAEAADRLQERIDDVGARIAALPATVPADSLARQELDGERAAYADALSGLRVDAALARLDGERVIARASPASATSPLGGGELLLLALVIGALVGVGVVGIAEYADDRVRRGGEGLVSAGGAAVLGMVPPRRRGRLGGLLDPREPAAFWPAVDPIESRDVASAEAFRALRATLLTTSPRDAPRSVLVTGCTGSDDARAVAADLAVVLARSGRPTMLVDADFRRPEHLARPVGGEDGDWLGLADVVRSSDTSLDDVMSKLGGVDDLFVVPAGHLGSSSAGDVLAGERAADVIGELRRRDELVVLVAPPVLRASETSQLAALVDATLVVVRAGTTRRRELAETTERLAALGAPRVGIVLVSR